ncbi:Coiled-coil domain-containing protein 96 [Acropora cervicornis]|uniref:Coiled-coil domain-containing protein 96 n=1 Tax=Acropora cervicornis TaxID=6130 RepID=A0AAD9R259_ACRCE|nr:Coiled-coil domain-containing protein 96 [Acropora cervicornis]
MADISAQEGSNSENMSETVKDNPTSQSESVQNQQTNNDSETPPQGDAIAEESSSHPEGGQGEEAPSITVEGEDANQHQEGGDGYKPELEGGPDQSQEKLGEIAKIEEEPDENVPMPEESLKISFEFQNEAIPETDEDPAVKVTESLSREGTPTEEDRSVERDTKQEEPDASATPPPPPPEEHSTEPTISEFEPLDTYLESDGMRYDEMEIDEESEPEVPVYDRAELIERYQQVLEERSSLQAQNSQLQHKLAEYFKKKKSDERQQEIEKNVTDQEQRYLKYMSNLEELQNEERRERESFKDQIEDLKAKCQEKQEIVDKTSDGFMMFKMDVAKQSINSRSGKAIPPKDLEQYQMLELKKEQEVMQVLFLRNKPLGLDVFFSKPPDSEVRLENIKLKNRLKKREMQLKAKEELAEGLHLIDFEQLKIENQTYNEKIEERNEELLKLRKKITTTVQVLTHLKEKLQFVQAENSEQSNHLRSVEAHVAQKRDILTRNKQVRDAMRIENVKLRQKCGLLGNEPLLRDYEQRKEQSDDLRNNIERLKMAHAELTMNCSGVRTKIEAARITEKQT